MTQPASNPASRANSIVSRILSGLFAVAVIAGGWFFVHGLNSGNSDETETATATEEAEAIGPDIVLPEKKIAVAGFTTDPVAERTIDHVHTVPGRLGYDEARHIEVKAPVSGVLLDVMVKPGDDVAAGQVLAVINSPEVGQARAAVLNELAKQKLVQQQASRLKDITTNLRSLFELLDRNAAVDEIERQFNNKALGSYRENIMSAYSQRFLANQLAEATRGMGESGSLPMKTVRERDNDRHVTDARFRSVRESTAYDVTLKTQQLDAELADAERQVMIAKNHLETLLGIPEAGTEQLTSDSLSKMEVKAPFAGTIEDRFLAKLERVRLADSLFVLANTDSLYVSADIRENDWAAMSVQPGQEITVEAPAIPGQTFTAKVHYIGREVAMESNSLPLIATIKNPDGLLRPGMFVRVTVPMAAPANVVAVRSESVMQHENEKFVFVAVNNNTFRRTDVSIGISNEEWVEVTEGVQVGQPVVSGGAFLLKSELLLAGEE